MEDEHNKGEQIEPCEGFFVSTEQTVAQLYIEWGIEKYLPIIHSKLAKFLQEDHYTYNQYKETNCYAVIDKNNRLFILNRPNEFDPVKNENITSFEKQIKLANLNKDDIAFVFKYICRTQIPFPEQLYMYV